MSYQLRYFARLGEEAGVAEEQVDADTADARVLYEKLCVRHGFTLSVDELRVAVNGVFAAWDCRLNDGDEIVFIPPVSGG